MSEEKLPTAASFAGATPYKLVDIGANLTNRSFNNRELDEVIERAKEAGKFYLTGWIYPVPPDVSWHFMDLFRRLQDYGYGQLIGMQSRSIAIDPFVSRIFVLYGW